MGPDGPPHLSLAARTCSAALRRWLRIRRARGVSLARVRRRAGGPLRAGGAALFHSRRSRRLARAAHDLAARAAHSRDRRDRAHRRRAWARAGALAVAIARHALAGI